MNFEHQIEMTNALRSLIRDTGQLGLAKVTSAGNGYGDVVNVGWRGAAAMAGMNKQNEFMNFWRTQLEPLLIELEENIGTADNIVLAADETSQQEHNVVTADGGGSAFPNFSRV